ncbi:MAG: hypothetical protein RIS79_2330 [Verrucomicrobiota bacterium]|jgi:hypothetical protein
MMQLPLADRCARFRGTVSTGIEESSQVPRGDDFLTVTAEYKFALEPEATTSLYITQTKA